MKPLLCIFFIICLLSCQNEERTNPIKSLDIQGHRGARGLYPENSLLGFQKALALGVSTLELDVCISKDSQVVVSHEPWMNASICLDADGEEIMHAEEKTYNLFQMTYDEIRKFNCGGKQNPRFPNQQTSMAPKPLLSSVFSEMDDYADALQRPMPFYNIEIKRVKAHDHVFHPPLEVFVKLVMQDILLANLGDRCIVQCFDAETLNYIHKKYPKLRLAFLVEEEQYMDMKNLNFTPEIFSPNFNLLDEKQIKSFHEKGIKVIPWTVNELDDMKKLINMGVDGIITDFPDVLINYCKAEKIKYVYE